ncbi:hypothetical protein FZEAL_3497 [Fusarium zealandicum]|uniref:Wax synthase domain-containing protein n=1 Tax=Fusarium zealandicum TaxID=1053134 RepID=A0A8H4UNN5_9HYPO|nr:hypothetical protein FZEAL_3497 [Fusarium zealandicum]
MMNLNPVIPLLYYGAASLLTIASMRLHKPARILSLGPIWLLSYLSLASTKYLAWPVGANSTFASLVVFYLPYSVKLLVLDELDISPELSSTWVTFADLYRVWNNPRQLPLHCPILGEKACTRESRANFALQQVSKAILLWTFDSLVFQTLLFKAFLHIDISDFAPDMELPFVMLSWHQLLLRAIVSVQWIWSAYFFLEFCHRLLAIVFVSMLGFDRPDEWPALFGSPLEAQSIRGFWGRFWHRITIPTYSYYSLLVCRRLLVLEPKSRLEQTMIPMLIFTMSGLSHSLVGWASGDAALHRDLVFFEVNFLAAAVETMVKKTKTYSRVKELLPPLSAVVNRVIGITWVFVFFFCVTPSWMYPKIYCALSGLL